MAQSNYLMASCLFTPCCCHGRTKRIGLAYYSLPHCVKRRKYLTFTMRGMYIHIYSFKALVRLRQALESEIWCRGQHYSKKRENVYFFYCFTTSNVVNQKVNASTVDNSPATPRYFYMLVERKLCLLELPKTLAFLNAHSILGLKC